MKKLNVTVKSESGLHARPAGLLVRLTKQFRSNIEIEKEGTRVNAKSIMGILSLGTSKGDTLTIMADGDDEGNAITALEDLFVNKLAHE